MNLVYEIIIDFLMWLLLENEEDYKLDFDKKVKAIMKSLKNTKPFT